MADHPIFLSRLALPVSWETLGHAPSADECDTAASANAALVHFLLHGVGLDAAHRAADERIAEAVAPLRIKLDIVIEMLGRLSYRDVELPPVGDRYRLCAQAPSRRGGRLGGGGDRQCAKAAAGCCAAAAVEPAGL